MCCASHCHGGGRPFARMQLIARAVPEARRSIKEALEIDEANHYSLEPLHRVYWVYSLLAEFERLRRRALKAASLML